ncbi:MAG: hypothetical protein KF889_25530 [Alphaproteobacteria bacterium]|nr:hypothetical protein [Alphaproteobacteria bacterium]MCW5739643.1 hypothetical protein [Alphaproteobacteria bacterium]
MNDRNIIGIDVARFNGRSRPGADRVSTRGLVGPGMFARLRSVGLRERLRMDLIDLLIASLRRLGCEVERYTLRASDGRGPAIRVETVAGGTTHLSVADQSSDRPEARPA